MQLNTCILCTDNIPSIIVYVFLQFDGGGVSEIKTSRNNFGTVFIFLFFNFLLYISSTVHEIISK